MTLSDAQPPDPYLRFLEEQIAGLIKRESDIDAMEAKLRADRAALAKEREEIEVAARRYREFLNRNRGATDEADESPNSSNESGGAWATSGGTAEPGFKKLSTRVGPKRRLVLEAVAALGPLSTREIAELTNINVEVVRNFVRDDVINGVLAREGEKNDRIAMTDLGRDFMRRAGIQVEAPSQNTAEPREVGGTTEDDASAAGSQRNFLD